VTVVVKRGTGRPVAAPVVQSRGFSEDPKALEPAVRRVEAELEQLVAANVTDPIRIAQGVRRTIGKWVGETYRRQPMIVPTVIEV
jgi:ribonuclease J